jgi:hypothetical protein
MQQRINYKHTFIFLYLAVFFLFGGCGGDSSKAPVPQGTFVASGGNGSMLTSHNGINWDIMPSGVAGEFSKVIQGNNIFVIWQNTGTLSTTILSSTDLMHWTVRSSNTFPAISSMIYANNIFVAVSSLGNVLTSPDGTNWINSATLDDRLQAVAYGSGTFVTVSSFGNIYHSRDCVNWTPAPLIPTSLYTVAYGNGIFVAAGGNEIFTSSDGENWTAKSFDLFPVPYIFSLDTGNNIFVALGWKSADPLPAMLMTITSPDGLNWSAEPSPVNISSANLSFANGLFFLTGINGTILTSRDGANWTKRISGTTEHIGSVAFVNLVL